MAETQARGVRSPIAAGPAYGSAHPHQDEADMKRNESGRSDARQRAFPRPALIEKNWRHPGKISQLCPFVTGATISPWRSRIALWHSLKY